LATLVEKNLHRYEPVIHACKSFDHGALLRFTDGYQYPVWSTALFGP
jgi:hypothetical protein